MAFMKWILKISLFLVCFMLTARFCKEQTGRFTILRITSKLTPQPEWETASLSPEEQTRVKQILSQPYSYLSKGVQSFVFASQDGQYVIKFFRHDHLDSPFWLTPNQRAKKAVQLHKEFLSYKLAYQHLSQQTGLVFLHLNKTKDLHQTLDLVDKLGIHHHLPLDNYEFLVQKRASLLYTALNQMVEENKLSDAKETLSNLVQLLAHRAELGISDKDPDLITNFGVIGTEPIQIDVGRFSQKEPKLDKDEIVRITDHLDHYLKNRCPELEQHLKTQIDKL
jgi:hypothetical protein